MNILFLTKGLARYRKNLIDGMADHLATEDKLMVATCSEKSGLWEVNWDELLLNKTKVHYREFPEVDAKSYIAAVKRSASHDGDRSLRISNERIEDIPLNIVAIQEFSWPMIRVAIYCRLAGIPCVVCTDLGMDSNWGTQFSFKTRLIHMFASWLTVGVVAHTAAAKNPVSAKWRPNCFAPHTVDIRDIMPGDGSTGDDARILMVATFSATKGHDLLVNAVSLLIERGVRNFKFRLVGTGDSKWLEDLIHAMGLSDYFDFVGVLKGEELFDEFRASDFFVLSSRGDTFGVVVHEAAAFGLPLLISKYAGASSVLIDEGKNGYVIDPYDATQFADRMEVMIKNRELRKSFGPKSRSLALQFCAHQLGGTLATWLKQMAIR